MGWSSGSGLAEDVWLLVRKHIPEAKRKKIAIAIYDEFCSHDADDWGGTTLEQDAGIETEDDD